MNEETVEKLAKTIEKDLLELYGTPLLSSETLQKALGYRSIDALRQAILRKTVPVNVFSLENRRGKFALVKDISIWLAEKATEAKYKDMKK